MCVCNLNGTVICIECPMDSSIILSNRTMIAIETFYTYLMYVKSKKKYEYNDVHEQPREQFYASAH